MANSAERLMKIYTVIRIGGLVNTRKIAEILGVSERTVQRHLKLLVEHGYVEPVRRGMRLYYRVVRPLTRREAKELVSVGGAKGDADVYRIARSIDNIIKEERFHADLVGAAKIHLLVPTHSRITHDIDVVVAREHASLLVTALKYGLNLVVEKRGGVHTDFRLAHPTLDVKVDIMVNGFREEGRLVWNLAPVLRRGGLTLEHAVIAKLTRRSFRLDSDGYDVAVSLPHIDAERFKAIYDELKIENPELARRVQKHLISVRKYVEREYSGEEAVTYKLLLRGLMRKIGVKNESEIATEGLF